MYSWTENERSKCLFPSFSSAIFNLQIVKGLSSHHGQQKKSIFFLLNSFYGEQKLFKSDITRQFTKTGGGKQKKQGTDSISRRLGESIAKAFKPLQCSTALGELASN